jgi:hypothetical protein
VTSNLKSPPLFSNLGQIIQIAIALLSCAFAGLKAWPDIVSSNLFATLPAIFYFVTIFATSFIIYLFHRQLTTREKLPQMPQKAEIQNTSTIPTMTGSAKTLATRISLGNIWKQDRIRIKLLAIDENKRPPERNAKFNNNSDYLATIEISTGDGICYCGEFVDKLSTNRFSVPIVDNGFNAEEGSIYWFSYSDDHLKFQIVSIEHINFHSKEIDLRYVSASLAKQK